MMIAEIVGNSLSYILIISMIIVGMDEHTIGSYHALYIRSLFKMVPVASVGAKRTLEGRLSALSSPTKLSSVSKSVS